MADAPRDFGGLQSHPALVLADWVSYARRDWTTQAFDMRVGDTVAIERIGTHALADSAWVLPAWLKHRLATVRASRRARSLPPEAGPAR